MPEEKGDRSGPRPFWSGTLGFGLVTVPVRLFAAVRSGGPSLRMVDEEGAPLEQRYVCPREERPVSRDEIVRGYEVSDGEWITVTEEELETLEPEKSREIDLRRFVPVEELDPVFFRRAYFLVPGEGGGKAYRLLAAVMEESGRAGVATFVMRGREYLVAILAREGILRAETMRFHDEIRAPADVGLEAPSGPDRNAVKRLVRAIRDHEEAALDEDELEDVEARELESLVERKRRKGRDVVDLPGGAREESAGGRVVDLLDVLRRSLEEGDATTAQSAAVPRRPPQRAGRRGGGRERADGADGLEERTKAELYERAKALDIPGRSGMSKGELVEAIRRSA